MLLPNQINTQRFSAVGKGGYRAAEVDAFIQKVFQNYNKLYNDNNTLKERLSAITPLIDEYNENKKGIANALIWAQTTSDKTVSDAKSQAQSIIEAAAAQAEALIEEKRSEAKAVYEEELSSAKAELEKALGELQKIKSEAEALSEKYISEVNEKAKAVITDANENASKIVAEAYNDARMAREKADEVLSEAKNELLSVKKEAALLKSQIEKAFKDATAAVSLIEISDFAEEEKKEEVKVEALQIKEDEIEEFTFDFSEEVVAEEKEEEITEAVSSEIPTGFDIETVIDTVEEAPTVKSDFISGAPDVDMPDVNAYITKIFESAGNEDSDFSSFSQGLDDILAQSLEGSNMSFDDLKNSMTDEEDSYFED